MELSCSSVVNRDTVSYDISVKIQLDGTFTPAVISAIDSLRLSSFERNEEGFPVPGTASSRRIALGANVTQGPVTIDTVLSDFPQVTEGHSYSVFVSIEKLHYCYVTHKNTLSFRYIYRR